MITILPLSEKDFSKVVPMLSDSWLVHAQKNDLYSAERFFKANDVASWLRRIMSDKLFMAYVAFIDDEAVGMICYEIRNNPSYFTYTKQLFILDIVVVDMHQGRGIATALEKQIEKDANRLGIHMVSGHVDAWNKASQALMKKLGRTKGYEEWHKIV